MSSKKNHLLLSGGTAIAAGLLALPSSLGLFAAGSDETKFIRSQAQLETLAPALLGIDILPNDLSATLANQSVSDQAYCFDLAPSDLLGYCAQHVDLVTTNDSRLGVAQVEIDIKIEDGFRFAGEGDVLGGSPNGVVYEHLVIVSGVGGVWQSLPPRTPTLLAGDDPSDPAKHSSMFRIRHAAVNAPLKNGNTTSILVKYPDEGGTFVANGIAMPVASEIGNDSSTK